MYILCLVLYFSLLLYIILNMKFLSLFTNLELTLESIHLLLISITCFQEYSKFIGNVLQYLVHYPFKAYWLREAPAGLTFNSYMFCIYCIYVFCIYLGTNSDLCHLQHKLFCFYDRDEKCLQRSTDWVFK
jgi:hypothetical protein